MSKLLKDVAQRGYALVAVLGVVATLLGVMGPFGTYDIGALGQRMVYWFGLVFGSAILSAGPMWLAQRAFPTSVLARESLTILVFTLLFTPCVLWWTRLMFQKPLPETLNFRDIGLYVLAICIVISVLRHYVPTLWGAQMLSQKPPRAITPETLIEIPRLHRRLPETFSGAVLKLSADGHRVIVSTTQGNFDIRMRLSDAISEMDTVEGVSAHRSHWVARSAIVGTVQNEGKVHLKLVNNETVPFSRKKRAELEAIGLL